MAAGTPLTRGVALMTTVPAPAAGAAEPAVSPVIATSPQRRRRRPSGEPPPLPRHIAHGTRWYLLLAGLAGAVWAGLSFPPTLGVITRADLSLLRAIATVRGDALTRVMLDVNAVPSAWTVRPIAWATIAALLVLRHFRHLAAYLAVFLAAGLLVSAMTLEISRMRPAGISILGPWEGYSQPSRPVAMLALVLVGALYTLVPAGRWRNRAKWLAAAILGTVCLARLYLAVDNPSDQVTALIAGWPLPVVAFRLIVPNDVFPVTYRGGRRAHLDVGGKRREAIIQALDHQLGLDVAAVDLFGVEASAGSTPLRLELRTPLRIEVAEPGGVPGPALFGKLYALNHLRSDRWYKLARTVIYGRLEDEKPFSTVRRLVEYEDHLLRLMRDGGLPTPKPYGFVEITPEREYLNVMEFCEGAQEIGRADVDERVIDDALRVVRLMWDAGVAHRDIKPSNVLARDGHIVLIDVAFAAVRPTPWRQAVDLANMMLTLALRSTPEHVYERAVRVFAAGDVAEAFAACRSITIPTQLRALIRADGRDLIGRFRQLAPKRRPVPIQLWDMRRAEVTAALVLSLAVTVAVAVAYVKLAGLL
jgi:tRNA A-37 threonylcarbamoyl transferase component Bud32/membrane-associated phospholipid phosphatase